MKIIKKKINFKDRRGTITDIFTADPKPHVTLIFSKKGAVRGNHYHKKSTQYTFVVSGQMAMYSQSVGKKKVHKHVLKVNDMMVHNPMEVHAMVAVKDTVFLAFADGVRGGKDYEKDTYRVPVGLEKQYKK